MTEEQFIVDQLREELESIISKHKLEIGDKNREISELKATIKTKRRVEDVTHAEYTQEYFPKFMISLLNLIDPRKKLSFWYIKTMSLLNYMLICSVGVVINMYVLLTVVKFAPLWLANLSAIFLAFLWNWNFTVGPLGYIMGLSPRRKKRSGK